MFLSESTSGIYHIWYTNLVYSLFDTRFFV